MGHRIVERFEAFMANNILFVYLISLFIGTAAFFTGHALGMNLNVLYVVAIATAFAVEIHSFLSQRLTRGLKEERDLEQLQSIPWQAANNKYWFHLRITFLLVLFSAGNSIAFWITQDHPQTAVQWTVTILRGMAVPGFFLAAGFLTPLRVNTHDVIQGAHVDMIRKTIKVTLKQFDRRLSKIKKSGANLVPVVATLLDNHGDTQSATQIRLVDAALSTVENGPMAPSRQIITMEPISGPLTALEPEPRNESTSSGFGTRAPSSGMLKQAAREHWSPGMSANELADRIGCRPNYAYKLIRDFENEQAAIYAVE